MHAGMLEAQLETTKMHAGMFEAQAERMDGMQQDYQHLASEIKEIRHFCTPVKTLNRRWENLGSLSETEDEYTDDDNDASDSFSPRFPRRPIRKELFGDNAGNMRTTGLEGFADDGKYTHRTVLGTQSSTRKSPPAYSIAAGSNSAPDGTSGQPSSTSSSTSMLGTQGHASNTTVVRGSSWCKLGVAGPTGSGSARLTGLKRKNSDAPDARPAKTPSTVRPMVLSDSTDTWMGQVVHDHSVHSPAVETEAAQVPVVGTALSTTSSLNLQDMSSLTFTSQSVTPRHILAEKPELEEIIGRHVSQGMFMFGNHPFQTDARPGIDYMTNYSYPNLPRALLSILDVNRKCDIYLFRNYETGVISVRGKPGLSTIRADYVQAIVVPTGQGQPLPLLMGSDRQMGEHDVEDSVTFGKTLHRLGDRKLKWTRLEDTVCPPGKKHSPTLKNIDKNFSDIVGSTHNGHIYVLTTTAVFKKEEDITDKEAGDYAQLKLVDMRPEHFPCDGDGAERTVEKFKVSVTLDGQELETFHYQSGAVVLDDDGDEVDFEGLDLDLQKSRNILASRPDIVKYLEASNHPLIEDKYKEFFHEDVCTKLREKIVLKMQDEDPKNAPSETAVKERFDRALEKKSIEDRVAKLFVGKTIAERKLAAMVHESIITAEKNELAKIHKIANDYRNE
mmetsp:Transcript_33705/g.81169  ORF Transcript_33705/g.81169 Transcript_33705/m.81169 type:complete len:672 (+) Transcript_33705:3-2018(+)